MVNVTTFSGFQRLMRELYFERDSRRGLAKTFMWFIEEVGEFSEAVRKGDLKLIGEEAVDVIAWLTSVANLLGVDLEKAIVKKYGEGVCPRCKSKPCKCVEG